MPYNRKAIAPWSTEREQGIESATVDSNIETPQYLQPVVNTGTIDLNGNWIGVRTSDKLFFIDAPHLAVPNGATVLSPQTADHDFIDMTGFNDLFIALKPTTGGNFAISAVMGPDSKPFANLTPVDAANVLRGASLPQNATADLQPLFEDGAQGTNSNVWTVFILQGVVSQQKNLQFKIVNNTGTQVDLDFAYMRVV